MATNLLISYADIPFRAVYVRSTPAPTTTPDVYQEANVISGERSTRFKFASSGTTATLDFDLGTGNTSSADHIIIARADILQAAGMTTLLVKRGSDGSAWTTSYTDASFASATLYGPSNGLGESYDYVGTISATDYRWWRVHYEGSSGTFMHSKVHLGTWFDFGKDPENVRINQRPAKTATWYSSNGTAWQARLDNPIYEIELEWIGITDAQVTAFSDNVVRYKHVNPVFLYTRTNHEILDSQRLIHCKLVNFSTEQVTGKNDYNRVKASFIEIVG